MASLLYLKHAYKLSDEELVERWTENVVWQYFSAMTFYEPRMPCDATQIGRFSTATGEAGVEELLKATIDTTVAFKAIQPTEFERLIVDTTVQEKAIAHPVDSRLLEIARHKVVRAAQQAGIALKQTFVREGKMLRRKAGGYGHARQFRRLRKVVKRQRTILGIVLREIGRKIEQASQAPAQAPKDKNKLYTLHAPEVECIGKAKKPLRVRRDGRCSGHAQTGPDGGCTQLHGQPLGRPYPGRATRTSDDPDRGHRNPAQAGDCESGLQRCGCGQYGH